jgi:hypothetical protein
MAIAELLSVTTVTTATKANNNVRMCGFLVIGTGMNWADGELPRKTKMISQIHQTRA